MIVEILGTSILVAALLGVMFLAFGKRVMSRTIGLMSDAVSQDLEERLATERQRAGEQRQADQELIDEKRRAVEQSNTATRDNIKTLVERLSREVDKGQARLETSEKDRIATFNKLRQSLDEYKEMGLGLRQSTDDLKNLLSNNQRRGKYGEEVAENLLKSVGFVKGQQFVLNESQDTAATRPDITLMLPDGQKLNVDVKFPFQSLVRYQEAKAKDDKQRHLAQFKTDVKQKIKEVTSRDYVSPEEGTVDFVVLFVPNEMIFSFIYEKMDDVWNNALRRKVILAGPFSFTAILRMVYQSYSTFSYQENVRDIIKLIKVFEEEWGKFSSELDSLGKRIDSTEAQFRKVSVTRTKKLSSVVEKIREGEEQTLTADTAPALVVTASTDAKRREQSLG